MAEKFLSKRIPIRGVTLSIADVKRIYERLSKHLSEEADRQISLLKRPEDQNPKDFDRLVAEEKKIAFRITVTLGGQDGQDVYGDTLEVFDSPNLPDVITTIYMTNITAYEGQVKRRPPNSFVLFLDFSEPPLVDNNNPVSNPTPNGSHAVIEGVRDAWVASVYDAIFGIVDRRKNRRRAIHGPFIYDVGLMLVGVPIGLYACWKLANSIQSTLGQHSGFLSSVAYVYLFALCLWGYRILFGYTKWAFPTVELTDNESSSARHRAFWYVINTGILSAAIFELWKALA